MGKRQRPGDLQALGADPPWTLLVSCAGLP